MKKIITFCTVLMFTILAVNSQSVSITGGNSVCTGASITLTANVTGVTAITYQWKNGATVLSSTDSICVINSAQSSDSGAYTVNITYMEGLTEKNKSSFPYPVSVTAIPTATISYTGTPFCTSLNTAQPVTINGTAAYTGGIYSSSAGLSINSGTGDITPNTSTGGIYTVTYTIPASGGCSSIPVTTSVTITTLPVATFSFTGTPYCSNASNPLPSLSGIAGTFSSTPTGLIINASTGSVNLASSTAGAYTVTNSISASAGCGSVSATSPIVINTLPAATISYSGTPFCKSITTAQAVTHTGTSGGTYTAIPAGLTIDASTGAITPSASTPGSYTVTYTIAASGGCGTVNAISAIIITAIPTATISYTGTPFCKSLSTAQPVTINGTAAYTGGIYSSSAGLSINSGTGDITPNTSTGGIYTVTYTIPASGGCSSIPVTTSVTITTLPVATFSFTGTPYCSNASNPLPSLSGIAGTFSSTPTGLIINASTGSVNLASSTAGAYTVTNSISASAGCGSVSATSPIVINTLPAATISYSGTPFCKSITTAQAVTHTGTSGGTYTAIPAGLTIDASTGAITPSTSTPGSYTVTYTIAASGGCGTVNATTTIIIIPYMTAGAASSTPTLCIYTVLTAITHTTILATGIGSPIGLPTGVTAAWAANIITISGTPSVSGTYSYIIPLTGGCGSVNATGVITVISANTVSSASSTPMLCINTPLAAIVHITTGANGIGVAAGLPSGIVASWAANTITISGTPTASGILNYSIPLTGGCGTVNATGSITVIPNNTISLTSGNNIQTKCINNAIADITYSSTGANTATFSGLPSGVNGNYSGGNITISGTPLVSGLFNYSITLTGGCGNITATGTINVTPQPTLNLTSGIQNQTVCSGLPIDSIVFTYGGSAISAFVNNLASGLNTSVNTSNNKITIKGIPLQNGNYTVSTVSSCTDVTLTGNIGIYQPPVISAIKGKNAVCSNQQGITYEIDNIPNRTYIWAVSGGMIAGQDTTNKITVNWGNDSLIGRIQVIVTDKTTLCVAWKTLTVPIAQISALNLNDIVAKEGINGEPYMLIYPNPPKELYYQWYKDSIIINGANEQFYYPASITAGATLEHNVKYKVYVALSTNRECGNFTNPYILTNKKSLVFTISPNPNNGNFYLSFNSETINVNGSMLNIYNLNGKIVYNRLINNRNELNFNLPFYKGFYIVKLTTNEGKTYLEKLIIK
ncbi:MAG: T9SS type A sorting domain-containing protein [Bacteroidales bacterium]